MTDYQGQTQDVQTLAAGYRAGSGDFSHWAKGYGVITHSDATQVNIHRLADHLYQQRTVSERDDVFRVLAAADRVGSAAMWLVAHMIYAHNVYLDGRKLSLRDFKPEPQGHSGGSLNMALAYVGYLAANSLTGVTRSWLMGQGHCVSAIDACNLLVANLTPAHAERYELSDKGLTRFVRDFYSYEIRPDGSPASPLGSHVNTHTAGGMMEGGYLGFAELQYVHMPLPGEILVVFLSDGAFEEQRGSDWTPRWWRNEDCGLVVPLMIMNGRRIDERSSMAMKGGANWLARHLRLNGFSPVFIDGRDPASFVWGICEIETCLQQAAANIQHNQATYPVPIYYGIAETVKGFGFPGAGTNRAHNLPLEGNPAKHTAAVDTFNQGAARLWTPFQELEEAVRTLNQHAMQGRPRERDHPLADRQVGIPSLPEPPWKAVRPGQSVSPMDGVDSYFCTIVKANPDLRVRVGNPDEVNSNRLNQTLDLLKHRVTTPETGVAEDIHGKLITALNEEAVVCAALANKAGLNLVASYEAFAVKMQGAIRQELVFARNQAEAGRPPGWLSVPVMLTSHTWENGKNEHSHQDPAFCEAMLGEMSDVSRVLFPADWNCAIAALRTVYASHGQIHMLVTPKDRVPLLFTPEQAEQMIDTGAVRLRGNGREKLLLTATGAYQLHETLKASARLADENVEHAVVYLQEPGNLRTPRDEREARMLASQSKCLELFPATATTRVFITHTRPEPYIGVIWPVLMDRIHTPVLGYINRGGTLNTDGLLFANRCSWAHLLTAAAMGMGHLPEKWLGKDEFAAVCGKADPASLFAWRPI